MTAAATVSSTLACRVPLQGVCSPLFCLDAIARDMWCAAIAQVAHPGRHVLMARMFGARKVKSREVDRLAVIEPRRRPHSRHRSVLRRAAVARGTVGQLFGRGRHLSRACGEVNGTVFRSLDAQLIARTDALFCPGALFGEVRARSCCLCRATCTRPAPENAESGCVLSPRGLRRTVKRRGRAGVPAGGR